MHPNADELKAQAKSDSVRRSQKVQAQFNNTLQNQIRNGKNQSDIPDPKFLARNRGLTSQHIQTRNSSDVTSNLLVMSSGQPRTTFHKQQGRAVPVNRRRLETLMISTKATKQRHNDQDKPLCSTTIPSTAKPDQTKLFLKYQNVIGHSMSQAGNHP